MIPARDRGVDYFDSERLRGSDDFPLMLIRPNIWVLIATVNSQFWGVSLHTLTSLVPDADEQDPVR